MQDREALDRATHYLLAQGSSSAQAHRQAIGWINQQVQTHATHPASIDVFGSLMLISAAAVPRAHSADASDGARAADGNAPTPIDAS